MLIPPCQHIPEYEKYFPLDRQLTGRDIYFNYIINSVLVNKATVDSGPSHVQLLGQLHHVLDLLLLVRHAASSINLALPAATSGKQGDAMCNVPVILYLLTMKVDTALLLCQ